MRMHIVIALLALTLIATPTFGQGNVPRGAGVGGAAGAVIGGIIGHQNHETAEGALIGGAVGAIAGGLLGKSQDAQDARAWHNYRSRQRVATQQASRAVSISDVVQLSRNGVSDSVIINQIQTRGVLQPVTVNDIVSMHQQGVHEPVISAMQRAPLVTATATQVRTYAVPTAVSPCYPSVRVLHPVPAPYYPTSYGPGYGHRHARHYGHHVW